MAFTRCVNTMVKNYCSVIMCILTCILLLAFASPTFASDKIKDAIAKGMLNKEFTDTLTPKDVPSKWRTSVVDAHAESYFRKIHSRGTNKILEVMWRKGAAEEQGKMFVATVYDGNERVASIMRIGDQTNIAGRNEAKGYKLVTSVKDDGSVSLMVTSEKGFFDVIEVRNRDTRLLDDLEYTRTALLMDQFGRPLLDAIQATPESKPKN